VADIEIARLRKPNVDGETQLTWMVAARDTAEAEVARLLTPPADITSIPPALLPALEAVHAVIGVDPTQEGLCEGVLLLGKALRTARRGWVAARAELTDLRQTAAEALDEVWAEANRAIDAKYDAAEAADIAAQVAQAEVGRLRAELATAATAAAAAAETADAVLLAACLHAERTADAARNSAATAAGLGHLRAEAATAQQLAEEVRSWERWAHVQLDSYPVGPLGLRATLAERLDAQAARLDEVVGERDAARDAAKALRVILAGIAAAAAGPD